MQFEYISGLIPGSPVVDWQKEESFVSAVAAAIHHHPLGERPVKTVHGEFRVSCRPLAATEMIKLGLSPQMRAEARFAVHIEGHWNIAGGERADIVLELHATTPAGVANPAQAYLHSSRTCIDLPAQEVSRIKQELLSALQLLG